MQITKIIFGAEGAEHRSAEDLSYDISRVFDVKTGEKYFFN